MLLSAIVEKYNQKYKEILRYANCTALSFDLGNGLYCIISPCAKQPGRFQCTFLDDKGPLSDSIRDSKEEIFQELVFEYPSLKLKEIIQ